MISKQKSDEGVIYAEPLTHTQLPRAVLSNAFIL